MKKRPASPIPPRPLVVAEEADEPLDLTTFVRRYVELVLEAEGVAVAEKVPARRMGS